MEDAEEAFAKNARATANKPLCVNQEVAEASVLLQFAARRLASTSRSVAEIAGEVGYESEAAFSRAFKREFGSPPAKFRRELYPQ